MPFSRRFCQTSGARALLEDPQFPPLIKLHKKGQRADCCGLRIRDALRNHADIARRSAQLEMCRRHRLISALRTTVTEGRRRRDALLVVETLVTEFGGPKRSADQVVELSETL